MFAIEEPNCEKKHHVESKISVMLNSNGRHHVLISLRGNVSKLSFSEISLRCRKSFEKANKNRKLHEFPFRLTNNSGDYCVGVSMTQHDICSSIDSTDFKDFSIRDDLIEKDTFRLHGSVDTDYFNCSSLSKLMSITGSMNFDRARPTSRQLDKPVDINRASNPEQTLLEPDTSFLLSVLLCTYVFMTVIALFCLFGRFLLTFTSRSKNQQINDKSNQDPDIKLLDIYSAELTLLKNIVPHDKAMVIHSTVLLFFRCRTFSK